MPIQPTDFLGVAQILAASPGECELRSATSRAYYAAFHACKDWHDGLPMQGANSGPPGGSHQQLINRLKNPDSGLPHIRKLLSRFTGTKLDVMRTRRHVADYQLQASPVATETTDQITQAQDLLLRLV